jgi:hypothetical protein
MRVLNDFLTMGELLGNLVATAFPLFIPQMFDRLGYNYSNTIFGGIAALMLPIPLVRCFLFVLFWGDTIRW